MAEIAAMQRFIEIFKSKIKREGADKLLESLASPSSDFFTAPASTRFHGSYPGGLCEHSLNVYDCLVDYLSRERVKEDYGIVLNLNKLEAVIDAAIKEMEQAESGGVTIIEQIGEAATEEEQEDEEPQTEEA